MYKLHHVSFNAVQKEAHALPALAHTFSLCLLMYIAFNMVRLWLLRKSNDDEQNITDESKSQRRSHKDSTKGSLYVSSCWYIGGVLHSHDRQVIYRICHTSFEVVHRWGSLGKVA